MYVQTRIPRLLFQRRFQEAKLIQAIPVSYCPIDGTGIYATISINII